MRVPSVGLDRDERRIVAEGYRLAEYMLRNYEDRPTLIGSIGKWVVQLRIMALARD